MLQLNNVSVHFNGIDGQTVPALLPIQLGVEKGEFVSVIGPNGSGKSTLLNAVSGTVSLNSGSIILNGQRIDRKAVYERASMVVRVFQNPLQGTASSLSVADNFRLAFLRDKAKKPLLSGGKEWALQARESIARLNMGLEDKWKQQMGVLSGGQRQALTLVMATLGPADLLLLDEPVAALDPSSAWSVMQSAAAIAAEKKLTVLHVTHKLSDALRYGNRLLVISGGTLRADLSGKERSGLTIGALEEKYFTYKKQGQEPQKDLEA